MTVEGVGFMGESVVRVDGVSVPTTFDAVSGKTSSITSPKKVPLPTEVRPTTKPPPRRKLGSEPPPVIDPKSHQQLPAPNNTLPPTLWPPISASVARKRKN